MLIKLLPEQAAKHWGDVRVAIEASLPPTVGMQSDRMSNILTAVMTGEITVWVSAEKRESGTVLTGMVLTTILFDGISGTKSLLIYCVYGYGEGRLESWAAGGETLLKYAKSQGCHRMIGYTDVKSIIKYAASIGADTKYTFVSFPI